MRHRSSILAAIALMGISSAALAQHARAELKDASGKTIGTATLDQTPRGVLIDLTLTGAPEGTHGLHIHSVGKCDAPFTTAGPHWNPTAHMHGLMTTAGGHAGDLPNVFVPAGGNLHTQILADGAQLSGATGILDADGAALVLHATADDYKSDPAGNAGARAACGVISAS